MPGYFGIPIVRILAAEEGTSTSALPPRRLSEFVREEKPMVAPERGPWLVSERVSICAGHLLDRVMIYTNDKIFVDTSVLVYARGRAETSTRARSLIERLWNSGGGALSTRKSSSNFA